MVRPLRTHLSAFLPLALAAPLAAQTPVEPYDVSGRYTTSGVNLQVTGAWDEGRDLLISWGRMAAFGRAGAWMPRAELGIGGTVGENLAERLMAGPQVTLARAFPSQHTTFGEGSRAEPYLLVGGSAFGIVDFTGGRTRAYFGPGVAAGLGFRTFSDEWDVELATIEVVVEKRFANDESPQIFIRFGRAVPGRRRPSADSALQELHRIPPPPPPAEATSPAR